MVKIAFYKEELDIPKDVEVELTEDHHITVKGPNGTITKDFSHARGITMTLEDNKIVISTNFPKSGTLALASTILNILKNLITGVQTNYKYFCKVCYSHFPCNVEVKPGKKELHVVNFLGERAPRVTKYLDNVEVKVDGDDVILIGPDKEMLGQTAANLKRCCKIRKKDPRVFQDGVYLYKKQIGDQVTWKIK
ncbi:MAG: 50S ribosomal protein L6 [Promethearchaeota archaeon]|jgi:large subunit ribosomal protein L6|nr:MAG: 50S ribosomal protein L6 [Candidatus Lokiarchaeota archaeon]